MYNDRRKKIIRISLIVLGVIILVLLYLFINNKQQQTNTSGTKSNFFLDLGSLITGTRPSPNGVPLVTDTEKPSGDTPISGAPFVSSGLPSPTPIAQNIGGGFGTNNGSLFPDGQDPNNCIGCNNVGDTEINSSYVYINAVPSAIHQGDEITVSWESANVSSCTATSYPVISGWSGNIEKNGNKYFSLKKPTTFIIRCTTTTGTVQASDSVSVLADDVPLCEQDNTCFTGDENSKYVSVVMNASPYMVEPGDTSLLMWNTENATMCNANSVPLRDDWRGLIPQHAGETNIILPSTPVTYILTCTDGKTTGQTDVTISVDTSGIWDGKGTGDDPIDLCNQSGQETNPLCLVRDVPYEEEEKRLILTDEEQATLDSLMKEVAVMSPTLPSNQTASSLDISTQTYKIILSDTKINMDACYDLTQNTSTNQDLIDALYERQMIGRRINPSLPESVINKYQVKLPSEKVLQKYRDYARSPGNTWRNKRTNGEGDCPGNRIMTQYRSDGIGWWSLITQELKIASIQGTFVFPWLADDCYIMNGRFYQTDTEEDRDDANDIYKNIPGFGRMQEQVEYLSDEKGIKIY